MASSVAPNAVHDCPQARPFPLMLLPLEIRRMIYHQALPSKLKEYDVDYTIPKKGKHSYRGISTPKACVGLLLVNKQIHSEAAAVLYDTCFVKAQISFWATNIHGITTKFPNGRGFGTPAGFHLLRNIEIQIMIPNWRVNTQSSFGVATLRENVRMLSSELVSRCPNTKTIVIKLGCRCRRQLSPDWLGRESAQCVPPGFLEELIQPLTRLRPSRSIEWKRDCDATIELRPVFERLFAQIKTSDA
ncbi:MAG: hypothetical protein Q9207_007057 [Kuettlingeria erythrocarpa]